MMRFCRRLGYYVWSAIRLLIGVKNWDALFAIFFGKPLTGLKWLKLRRNNLSMAVTSKMEAWSVKESLIDRFYTRYSETIQTDWTIVDIGGSIGEFTVEAALQVPEGKVYAFEPNPGSINILRQNVRANELKNIETHNIGIWKETGEITLEIRPEDPIHGRSFDGELASDAVHKRTTIPVVSLRDMLETIVVEKVDLLKMDTEGTEFDILMNEVPETFKKVQRIIMEVHESPPDRTIEQMTKRLNSLGYETQHYTNKVHSQLSYLYAWRSEKI